jgi:transposase-like protein
MTAPVTNERYKNHRFPSEIISHGVWLYYRFTLSYRDVQELLFERGIIVSHELYFPLTEMTKNGWETARSM